MTNEETINVTVELNGKAVDARAPGRLRACSVTNSVTSTSTKRNGIETLSSPEKV